MRIIEKEIKAKDQEINIINNLSPAIIDNIEGAKLREDVKKTNSVAESKSFDNVQVVYL
jgi:hypothetical protein